MSQDRPLAFTFEDAERARFMDRPHVDFCCSG